MLMDEIEKQINEKRIKNLSEHALTNQTCNKGRETKITL
jgi:hypothetical protein